MEESLIPSLSGGVVGSRFITQDEVETAKARREEQWKAAYARLGQEPPPQQREEVYDGRSLAEKLAANRIAKQEEWEEKTKLANQFRALEEDEIMFLDSIREKQEEEERIRKERDGEELKQFKEAVAARTNSSNPPPNLMGQSSKPSTTNAPSKQASAPVKKDAKKLLKGVVVKKKSKVAPSAKPPSSSTSGSSNLAKGEVSAATAEKRIADQGLDDEADLATSSKRQKTS